MVRAPSLLRMPKPFSANALGAYPRKCFRVRENTRSTRRGRCRVSRLFSTPWCHFDSDPSRKIQGDCFLSWPRGQQKVLGKRSTFLCAPIPGENVTGDSTANLSAYRCDLRFLHETRISVVHRGRSGVPRQACGGLRSNLYILRGRKCA